MAERATRLTVTGRMETEACLALMQHFLRRLDLKSRILSVTPGRVTVDVQGNENLIDMFEMACWLGPENGRVDDVQLAPLHAQSCPGPQGSISV